MAACPECGGPLVRGRFCRACGYDADLEEQDDAYLDGVDVPDEDAEWEHQQALERQGLAPPKLTWRRVVFVFTALFLLWWLITQALRA